MKKLLGLLAITSMALVGCSQEDEPRTASGATFEDFTGEIINSESRTSMDSDGSVLWSENDCISLFRKNGYHQKYKVETWGTSSTNFIYDGISNEISSLAMNYAVYPYNQYNGISGSKITVDLSTFAEQKYTANTFENAKAVMVAKSDTRNFAFTNAFSLANFELKAEETGIPGDEIYVTKIKVESATKPLSGLATIDMLQDRPAAQFNENGSKVIELICETPVQLNETAKNFYVLMPATSFPERDLSITIYAEVAGDDKECPLTITSQAEFLRSKVTTLPARISLDRWSASTELTLKNVATANEATQALATNTGVKIADAEGTTEQAPITIPAKEEAAAAKEHIIEFATMPSEPVYITVAEGDGSTKTVKKLEVIVPVGTTSGNLNINAPGTTVTIKATDGTVIDTIEAVTAENTLIIESGVTVNNLIVKGGNVEVYGKVGNISRAEDNQDAQTYIYLKEGAEVENYPTSAGIFVVASDNNLYVYSCEQLQAAINNAATGDTEIYFGADLTGDVIIQQKVGVNLVINGNDYEYCGTIEIDGNARQSGEESLTITKVNFVTTEESQIFIDSNDNTKYGNKYNYAHNVKVEECTFTATGAAENTAVAMKYRQSKNMTVEKCTSTGLHSLMQCYGVNKVTVENVNVSGKNGISLGTSFDASINNSTYNVTEYGVRGDGDSSCDNIAIENTNITASKPIIIRRMTGSYNVNLNAATLTAAGLYQVVFTNGEDDADYVVPAGNFTICLCASVT